MRAATRARNQRRGVDLSRARTRPRNPVEVLLSQAELWLDASKSDFSTGKMTNRGTGGSALDAQFGSTTGADTNDPKLLAHTGTNYLYLPGVAGNYASSPDSNALDVTPDVELVCRVALDDWTPAAEMALIGKFDASINQRGYVMTVTVGGNLAFRYSGDGIESLLGTSTAALPLTDGQVAWVRATFDGDNGAGGRTMRFYYAADQATEPTSWTQLGADVVDAVGGTRTLFVNTAVASIGAISNGATFFAAGKFYRAIIRSTPFTTPTTVFDADPTRSITSGGQTTFTESSANAATVTINRATSGRKSVAVVRPVLLFGTDDYLEVADNALLNMAAGDSFSVVAVFRDFATPASFNRVVSKRESAAGWELNHNSTLSGRGYVFISDGTLSIDSASLTGTYTQGNLSVLTGVRDVAADKIRHYVNATVAGADITDSTTASLSNALAMRIGRAAGVATNYADMEFVAAAVFRRALTAAEIASIVAYYGAS